VTAKSRWNQPWNETNFIWYQTLNFRDDSLVAVFTIWMFVYHLNALFIIWTFCLFTANDTASAAGDRQPAFDESTDVMVRGSFITVNIFGNIQTVHIFLTAYPPPKSTLKCSLLWPICTNDSKLAFLNMAASDPPPQHTVCTLCKMLTIMNYS